MSTSSQLVLTHPDILQQILVNLDIVTLCKVIFLVSPVWNKLGKSDIIWEDKLKRDFGWEDDFNRTDWPLSCNNLYDLYKLYTSYISWNTSISPSEITYKKSSSTNFYNTAIKNSHSPDITYIVGKSGFTQGNPSWSIRICSKGSEMRIGFTTHPDIYYSNYTLSDKRIWIWSDCGRFYSSSVNVGQSTKYGVGHWVGVELDFRNGCCRFYLNGELKGDMVKLPPGKEKLYPLVALDAALDRVVILRGIVSEDPRSLKEEIQAAHQQDDLNDDTSNSE